MDTPVDLALRLGGVAPNVLHEFSGVYPTFVSAFKELVSNAFDAGATLVAIHFSPDLGTVTIEDNGIGMTPFELQDEYIRIGGSLHHRGEDVTSSGRKPIGRKGIGFLAVARYCHLVEILSRTDREVTFSESGLLVPPSDSPSERSVPFFQGPFSPAFAPFVTVKSVQCDTFDLTPAEYSQAALTIELSTEAWARVLGRPLTIQYVVDCRPLDLWASIDYDYLLSLADNCNLETISDFCRIRLVHHDDATKARLLANPESSFTQITLHLRAFVQQELRAPQRRGRVRNVASANGFERFLWHLSRSVPVRYALSDRELERHGLGALAGPISSTPLILQVVESDGEPRELKRPLCVSVNDVNLDNPMVIKQAIHVESEGLSAHGYLMGFPEPIFPAELRGIAVRVRGVEIGQPSFFNVDNDLPVKYRPFLNQVTGEVIVREGLDAISAIMPGREGFYVENIQFQELRKHLVGDGVIELGALGNVLCKLREQRSVESSVARVVQEAQRRRKSFLDVSQAVTTLSVGSRYSRPLRQLFSRSDVEANGLRYAPEYQVSLPNSLGEYKLELSRTIDGDFRLDPEQNVVQLNSQADMWSSSLYILGRDFDLSLRSGGPGDPLCELDLARDTIYLNWMHPTRGKMGDAMFIKSALFWRIAYLAAGGDVDLMMNLAHHLLSFATE